MEIVMRKPSKMLGIAYAALLVAGLATLSGTAHAVATAEPMDVDPEILAKLAKDRAAATSANRRATSAAKADQKNAQSAAECGSIAIGNVIGNDRIGFGPTDVNVIIVGDVVNANNNCK
jgi:hypothetical protein